MSVLEYSDLKINQAGFYKSIILKEKGEQGDGFEID